MDGSSRRRGANGAVPAGSVWETRMKKLDEFKVFNSEENEAEDEYENSDENNSPVIVEETSSRASVISQKVVSLSPKQRKTWKSEGNGVNPIQIVRQRPELSKNVVEQCNDLSSLSGEGIKGSSPIQVKKKSRSDDVVLDKKSKSLTNSSGKNQAKTLKYDGNEKNFDQRKVKAELNNVADAEDENCKVLDEGVVRSSVILDGPNKNRSISNQTTAESMGREENCREFDVCEEKVMTSSFSNVGQAKSTSPLCAVDDEEKDEALEGEEMEVQIEKKGLVIKQMSSAEQKPKKHQFSNLRPLPSSPIVKKQLSPAINSVRIRQAPSKTNASSVPEELPRRISRNQRKLQSFVDIVMWRDVPRSAFIFGLGTFLIISSSYAQAVNVSIISVFCYLGLLYLAAIFLFRSLICRAATDKLSTSQEQVIGEEEAIWFVKFILPYVNEFLFSLRALFSGDPVTTMKMAVLLFLLARFGSSITVWNVAKLGFFGVFSIPKIYSSYSTQITEYGKSWILRFGDAWKSFSHKKAAAFGVFTLFWNLSSILARIWAVFMLFVAFKYNQQSLMMRSSSDCGGDEDETRLQDSLQGQVLQSRRNHLKSNLFETRRQE